MQPGLELDLLDGKYTPRNRPIQDLVTFHEVGVKELGLHWPALLTDLAETPVKPIQLHYMRVALPQGELTQRFPNGWAPQQESLLRAVLAENRRYQAIRNPRLLERYRIKKVGGQWECSDELREQTVGL